MDALVASLAVFLAVTVVVLAAAARSPSFFKLALSFFLKRKRLTMLTVLALVVGSSMVTGSLAVGDSMKQGVIEGVYGNLGAVDEVVHSNGLYNESIFHSLQGNTAIDAVTDAIAPLMVLMGSISAGVSGPNESRVNIVGYSSPFMNFGSFVLAGGENYVSVPLSGEALLNLKLANALGVSVGDKVRITVRNPEFSVESIYSNLAKQVSFNVNVSVVVADSDLGRFSLESGGRIAENVFLNLSDLQGILKAGSKVNTIVVSNNGDSREGVKHTEEVTQRLRMALDEIVGFKDLKFHLDVFNYLRLENENVFFDSRYGDLLDSMIGNVAGMENVSLLTSYFVNNISFGGNNVPYSTVAGLNSSKDYAFGAFIDNSTKSPIVGDIHDDEIILTNYTASRLGASVGDTVRLNYTVYVGAFTQVYRTASFTVRHVIDMTGKANDPNLMPPFPGIRGKASCGDWDPPWVSGDKMRGEMTPEDLRYWLAYGGTPKAYITLEKARELWSNDLGNLTTIKVKGTNLAQLVSDMGFRLDSSIAASDAGISIIPAKAEGIESAEGVQLLTETFLAFGAVVIISGIILAVALVGMVMEGRRKDIGVLKTLGAKRRQITQTFAFEAFFLSLISSAIGILAGLLVAFACITLTNVFWSNIVEGTTVSLYFTADTLVVGYVAGFFISFLAFTLSAHWMSGSLLSAALRESEGRPPRRKVNRTRLLLAVLGGVLAASYLAVQMDESSRSLTGLAGPVLIMLSLPFLVRQARRRELLLRIGALAAIVYTVGFDLSFVSSSESTPFLLFFASGFAIIASCVAGLSASMRQLASAVKRIPEALGANMGTMKLAFSSPARRARRTCLAVSLFAVVIFTYLGLSVNIEGQQLYLKDLVEHQGAGYDVLAESSISVRFDLGNASERAKNNIVDFPGNATVVQFLTYGQIGGSCSNLKRNLPPRLIGANESFTSASLLRFQAPGGGGQSVWNELDAVREDGSIPAIGDSNTVVWILGKNVGDHIPVIDERGVERQLVVVGITENSIFPGSVFVSEDSINDMFPTTAEYRLFLFKAQDAPAMASYIESHLQGYGMDATLVDDLVRSNLSVEWSYMGLFQALLLLGLVVGIFGLAASSARAVEERKSEIGTMRAMGFSRSMVLRTLLLESLYIASIGAVIGILAGLLTSFAFFGRGSLLSYRVAIPWLAMIAVIIVVDVAALVATLMPAKRAAGLHPVEALRREQ